jgi:hypothetical protein
MDGLPFLAGGGVNLTGLQIVDISEDNFTIVTRSRASEIDWTACILQTQSL